MSSRFVYVIFIRTTPEKLWDALIKPEFTRQYWCETVQECDWEVGSPWRVMIPDGRIGDSGEVLEIDPPKKLVFTWRNEFRPDLREEGYSVVTFTLEPADETVKLTVVHEMDRLQSKLIEAVSGGWPVILSSLKSFIETGSPLEQTRRWPKDM